MLINSIVEGLLKRTNIDKFLLSFILEVVTLNQLKSKGSFLSTKGTWIEKLNQKVQAVHGTNHSSLKELVIGM